MHAAFIRALKGKRITNKQYDQVINNFDFQWDIVDVEGTDSSLIEISGRLAQKYALKGCDAFQLASAFKTGAEIFICCDKDLTNAAIDMGIAVWNPEEGNFSETNC